VRPDRDRLADILEAIAQIRDSVPGSEAEFESSRLLQVWAVHHLQIIGEAANNLSPGLVAGHPEIPWRKIIDMRHALVHQYFGIDLVAVWRTVIEDLPTLEASVRAILADLP
jgi:uncharacterized protein with HEPN domain